MGAAQAAPSSLPGAGPSDSPSAFFKTVPVQPPPRPTDFVALFALACAMLLWSGTFIAMKLALVHFHPVFMVFLRMTASTLLLIPFMRAWAKRTPYSRGDWRIIGLLVLAEPCFYFMFEAYALRYTTASQAGVITSLLPLLVGVTAYFVLKERLGKKTWIGFFLAMAGVVALTLSSEDSDAAPNALFGNILELLAMLMACVYTLCVRKLRGYPPFFITAMQAGAGMIFFGVLFLAMGAPLPETLPPVLPGAPFDGTMLQRYTPYLAIAFLSFSTIVAYGLYNTGIARLSAGQAAAWINLIPAITLVMGIVMLDERLGLVQALALIPIVIGVVLSQLR